MYNPAEAIPEGYVKTEFNFDGVTVNVWRNPNADPELRQKKLQELTNMLYGFRLRRLAREKLEQEEAQKRDNQ